MTLVTFVVTGTRGCMKLPSICLVIIVFSYSKVRLSNVAVEKSPLVTVAVPEHSTLLQ